MSGADMIHGKYSPLKRNLSSEGFAAGCEMQFNTNV